MWTKISLNYVREKFESLKDKHFKKIEEKVQTVKSS